MFAKFIDRGDSVAFRQSHQLISPAKVERVGDDHQRVGPLLADFCEDGLEFILAARIQNLYALANRLRQRQRCPPPAFQRRDWSD